MYPALMIEYDYLSRNVEDASKYKEIRDQRLVLKKKKDPTQLPLKIVLNSTYGAMKDKYNDLFDPLMANNVCIGGQLLLLDLIEKVEPYCKLIQSNTDGILVKIDSPEDKAKYMEECEKWCKRSRLDLEHDAYTKVIQKDVNNYIIVEEDGSYKSKGAYVKKLNDIDNDLPIVNEAIVKYFTKNIPVEQTILECDELIKFQKIVKVTSKYKYALHNGLKLPEKVFRVFASNNEDDSSIFKIKTEGKLEKISYTPVNCFIDNSEVKTKECPPHLDKLYYIDIANDRIHQFENNEFKFKIDSGIKRVNIDSLTWVDENMDKYDDFLTFYKDLVSNTNKTEREAFINISKFSKFAGIIKLKKFVEMNNLLSKKTFKMESVNCDLEKYLRLGETVTPILVEKNIKKEHYEDYMEIIKENPKSFKVKYVENEYTFDHCDLKGSTYKNIDKESLLRIIWDDILDEDETFMNKARFEMESLGYVESEIPKGTSLASVEASSKQYRSLNLKSLRNNQRKWFKLDKNLDFPEKGDILSIKVKKKIGYKNRKESVVFKYEVL